MKIPLLPEAIALFTGTLLVSQTMAATDFTAEIEPLLIRRCFECHGPDKQKSNLRLDSRAAAFQAAESGKVVLEVGKPETSELIRRITATDPDEVMPPKGPRLTQAEVTSLTRWIREGALWPDSNTQKHWSFQAPIRTKPPENLPKTATLQNPIDRFIVARLAKEGLQQQPEADRANLIRRVSLDLTGLPPAPSEISAFLADSSPRAFENLVDRLLASSHYGEHMARGWLDLARYADSNGYQVDLARSIWPYRQWVIEAFNKNQPFDQFTIDQLAGDLLPQPTLAQRIATGFNRNTKVNDEGGGDAEEYRTKAVKDRVTTVGMAWLGLTLNCAECHTHKYDPITHEEYYRFYSFFNNSSDSGNYSLGPSVEVPKPDMADMDAHVSRRLQETRDELSRIDKELQKSRAVWEKSVARKADPWRTLQLVNPQSTGGSSYTNLPDGSLLGTGVNPIYDTITVEADTDLTGITAVLLEVLPDPSLPKNGPGRWGASGNFILDEFSFAAAPKKGIAPANTNLFFSSATADWEQQYYKAEHAIDRNPKTGWSIGPRFGQRHFLIARLQDPTGYRGGSRLTFRFDHYHGNSHCIGRFRISVTTEKDPQRQWPLPEDVRVAASRSSQERSTEQSALLAASQRSASEKVRTLESELFVLEQNRRQRAGQKFTTLVMQERPDPQPRETYIHLRGDFLTKGKVVQPGIPAVFPPLPAGLPANRLTLARWLVDPANPLTARVTVNRFWERCFGTGLVKTSEDFGRQGELPSHPELLDWLATEFIASGWDVKALQKLIVMSATYRQSAATDATRQEKDFYNRFLSRGPRFRMDAEMIRDHALAVSGLLHHKVGGPSVYPVQVANLWKEIGFLRPEIGMDEWPVSDGPDLYRRALYTFWRRVCTYPTLATFDAPSREVCVSRRPRTNTPLQALAALNEPTLLEAARFFGQRILAEGGPDDASRVDYAFTRSVGRPPTAAEQRRLLAFVLQQERSFRADPKAAAALIQVEQVPKAADLETRKLAVWTTLASVLFNLDETLTKG